MKSQHRVLTERQMTQIIKAKADLERSKKSYDHVQSFELTEQQKKEQEEYIRLHGCPF